MKILADENMDAGIIAWLRATGCDVLSVMESMRGAKDHEILERANRENRIILIKDMDFGEMVFFDKLPAAGIILLRLHAADREMRLSIVQRQWDEISRHAAGKFLVVTQERLRIRQISPR